ncbi:MAG TPA: ABC transporter substrate-binding protein [Syntrophales bacterium]|nr:ABC transporter substrate-binding protein [Syntrophales bacterium]
MRAMWIGLGMLVLVLVSAPVHAATPLETVRTEVNKVLDALRNKGLKEEAKKETLRLVYKEMFDQVELAKWSLGGNNWNKFTEAQRQEFVPLFQQVLEKAYADKILAYTDEKITFDREVTVTKNRVEVQTRVLTKSKEIPINYRVVQESDGTWKVYDVVVENVSLVMNYRSQFNDILSKNKPEQLLETLRKKVKDQKA